MGENEHFVDCRSQLEKVGASAPTWKLLSKGKRCRATTIETQPKCSAGACAVLPCQDLPPCHGKRRTVRLAKCENFRTRYNFQSLLHISVVPLIPDFARRQEMRQSIRSNHPSVLAQLAAVSIAITFGASSAEAGPSTAQSTTIKMG